MFTSSAVAGQNMQVSTQRPRAPTLTLRRVQPAPRKYDLYQSSAKQIIIIYSPVTEINHNKSSTKCRQIVQAQVCARINTSVAHAARIKFLWNANDCTSPEYENVVLLCYGTQQSVVYRDCLLLEKSFRYVIDRSRVITFEIKI